MKILIADDSAFMRAILKDIVLKKYPDAQIVEAADGIETVNQYKSGHPDLIMLDIIMPNKDGIEVLKEIGHEAVIMIVSSVGQEAVIEQAKALGAKAFINKPFETNEVIKTMEDILHLSPAPAV